MNACSACRSRAINCFCRARVRSWARISCAWGLLNRRSEGATGGEVDEGMGERPFIGL